MSYLRKFHLYVERTPLLFDFEPTHEPSEAYTMPSFSPMSRIDTPNQDVIILSYTIAVSIATSVLSTCCIMCVGYYFIVVWIRDKRLNIMSISELSSSRDSDTNDFAEFDDIYKCHIDAIDYQREDVQFVF